MAAPETRAIAPLWDAPVVVEGSADGRVARSLLAGSFIGSVG